MAQRYSVRREEGSEIRRIVPFDKPRAINRRRVLRSRDPPLSQPRDITVDSTRAAYLMSPAPNRPEFSPVDRGGRS